jgi:hypothetical protein
MLVLACCVLDAVELGRADDQRVVVVALHELHAPSGRIEPDPPGVAGHPGLGKGNQLDALAGRLGHEVDGLVDGAVEIEEHGRGLNGGDAQLGVNGGGHGRPPEAVDETTSHNRATRVCAVACGLLEA